MSKIGHGHGGGHQRNWNAGRHHDDDDDKKKKKPKGEELTLVGVKTEYKIINVPSEGGANQDNRNTTDGLAKNKEGEKQEDNLKAGERLKPDEGISTKQGINEAGYRKAELNAVVVKEQTLIYERREHHDNGKRKHGKHGEGDDHGKKAEKEAEEERRRLEAQRAAEAARQAEEARQAQQAAEAAEAAREAENQRFLAQQDVKNALKREDLKNEIDKEILDKELINREQGRKIWKRMDAEEKTDTKNFLLNKPRALKKTVEQPGTYRPDIATTRVELSDGSVKEVDQKITMKLDDKLRMEKIGKMKPSRT